MIYSDADRVLYLTISDSAYCLGTLAAVNSILFFHPDAKIKIISSGEYNERLSENQRLTFLSENIEVLDHSVFAKPGRVLGAWQLKAYAAADLGPEYDLLIGFDSDAVVCAPLTDIIEASLGDQKIRAGRDGAGILSYDESYKVFGIPGGQTNYHGMSTSFYFLPINETTREVLRVWADCSNTAAYGPQDLKIYPGGSDQSLLNAILFSRGLSDTALELLENRIWSQHGTFMQDTVVVRDGALFNVSCGQAMRVAHVGGMMNFWSAEFSEWIREEGQGQLFIYAWFLNNFWFGACGNWDADPFSIVGESFRHLFGDIITFYYHIEIVNSELPHLWPLLPSAFYECAFDRVSIMMGEDDLEVYRRLAQQVATSQKVVEVGAFEGGAASMVAASLLNTRATVYAVESFLGDLDGSTDGWELPSMPAFAKQTKAKYPFLKLIALPLPSHAAAELFSTADCDLIFLDTSRKWEELAGEVERWRPKVRRGGILAGTNAKTPKFVSNLAKVFPEIEVKGDIWWAYMQ
jgi:hypothetical protein